MTVSMVTPAPIKVESARFDFPIVLLPGWGFDQGIWAPVLPFLSQWADLYHGLLTFDSDNIDVIIADLEAALPEECLLLGWSLGGMVATRLAARYPGRVKGLITLATNASFIARAHWPTAMDAGVFREFYQRVNNNPVKGLQRFCRLVSYDDQATRQQVNWLQDRVVAPEGGALLMGLSLLMNLDNSDCFNRVVCPSLHMFGEQDALVPVGAAKSIAQHLRMAQKVRVLANVGHLLHYPETRLLSHLHHFFEGLIHD